MSKNINEMTKKEFLSLPHRKFDEIIICDDIIIIPGLSTQIHDSNFRVIDFVAVKSGKPICLLSGCSDVICLDGIDGEK